MGTPVKIRAREDRCVGAGSCSNPRPMTEAEMLKYYTKEEIKRMSKKIDPPEREKLLETLAEIQGKTKAIHHAAKIFNVSYPVVCGWIKEYGIGFDVKGTVVREPEEFKELDKQMQKLSEVEIPIPVIDDAGAIHLEMKEEASEDNTEKIVLDEGGWHSVPSTIRADSEIKLEDTITITGQETKEITRKLGYAEHDVGNATIIYDFRADLVKVVTPNDNEMTPEVARAVAEDILDILGHE
jgi:transposase-like protein